MACERQWKIVGIRQMLRESRGIAIIILGIVVTGRRIPTIMERTLQISRRIIHSSRWIIWIIRGIIIGVRGISDAIPGILCNRYRTVNKSQRRVCPSPPPTGQILLWICRIPAKPIIIRSLGADFRRVRCSYKPDRRPICNSRTKSRRNCTRFP